MSTRKQKVSLFWPEERIEALKTYAQDTSEDVDTFEQSKRMAWMREFCMSAPSWLVADSVRLRLKVRAQEALAKVAEAQADVEGLLHALESMAPLEDTFQDKWASRIVNAPHEPANPPERKPAERLKIGNHHLSDEAMAEVETANLDLHHDRSIKEILAKVYPQPGQKLPGEVAFDLAHGKTEGGKMEPPLRERLAKMSPDTLARVLGPSAKKPVPLNETEEEHRARVGYPQAETENFEDEHIIAPNPDEEVPDERPKKRARNLPKSDPTEVAERPASDEAGQAAPVAETVAVKRADGKIMHRKPRTGFRMELKAVVDKHGEEVANYLVSDILDGKTSTAAIRQAMGKFQGTFASHEEAVAACAKKEGVEDHLENEMFEIGQFAAFILSHEDGRCSWWAKAA